MTRSAVLLLIFNRPVQTEHVFKAIRTAKPARLYIAADGPRAGVEDDKALCQQARDIAMDVDWPCDVFTQFQEANLGCKRGVSTGIDWFFEQEEQGIILEDDCLPHCDFFRFADVLLVHYAENGRVWVVTGDNFQSGAKRGEAAYYFSRYNHCWGWASWRRAWKHYDDKLAFWPQWRNSVEWRKKLPDPVERRYWTRIFDKSYKGEIDSWAYPWTACVWYHGGLTATPNVNLVRNIGFGPDARHTKSAGAGAGAAVASLGSITHPDKVAPDQHADRYTFDHHFRGRNIRWPRKLLLPGIVAAKHLLASVNWLKGAVLTRMTR